MEELTQAGVTHVVNMHWSSTTGAGGAVWGESAVNPTDDDFLPKPPELLRRGVDFALAALEDPEARVYVHCAAGCTGLR